MKVSDYRDIVGESHTAQLYRMAEPLRGKRLVMVNSTSAGGGVAEILHRLVPLLNDLGINTRWEVIKGDETFFNVTKTFHNTLQGNDEPLTDEMFEVYKETNRRNAAEINLDADFVVIHDPQPAALIDARANGNSKWIWRCHIDVSHPNSRVWQFLRGYVERYDASIFSMSSFAQDLPHPQVLINPSIDPLSEKNRELTEGEIEEVFRQYGIPRDKPILLQVSRFDRFKDPIGVIRAYQLVKKHQDCRLVLAGGAATDDPEGAIVLAEVQQAAADDPDIHVLLLPPFSDKAINALQRGADIVFQKSLREGFGLTVSEALWKGKPVIGGAAGGITLQVIDGHTGYLVHSVEGAAYRARYLLRRPELSKQMGAIGREYVRRNFLSTRNVRDYLALLLRLPYPGQYVIQI